MSLGSDAFFCVAFVFVAALTLLNIIPIIAVAMSSRAVMKTLMILLLPLMTTATKAKLCNGQTKLFRLTVGSKQPQR